MGSLAFAALLAFPAILWAHARLLSSNPAGGAVLTASPATLRLVFSERPELALASIRLAGAGDTINLGPLGRDPSDPAIVVAPLGRVLAPGPYVVIWRVAGRDGHPIRGTIQFTVAGDAAAIADPVTTPAAVPTAAEPDEENAGISVAVGGAIGFIIVRWLAFISLFLMIGAVVFKKFVLDRIATDDDPFARIASTNAATLGFVFSGALALTAILKFARESSDMPDAPIGALLFGSLWGMSLFTQMILALAAVSAFRLAHKDNVLTRKTAWNAAFATAIAAGITPAFGGHAVAGDTAYVAVPADIVHVIGGSAWLGTLAVIMLVAIPAALKTPDDVRPGARVAMLINKFSPLALTCGASVVATGLGASVIRLPRLDVLWTTPYGVVLLLKLVFVLFLFGAGAWNWRRMKPRLTGDDAIAPLRSSASLELVLTGIVLGLTAILVATQLP
ncbi:MAG: copper resistance CopC/CopD family protein [Gemmatimonadaceae bacterium]